MKPFRLDPRQTLAATAATLCALALIGLWAARGNAADAQPADAQTPTAKPALTVSTARPVLGRLPVQLSANGNITAWQEASVGSEASGWRLAEVRVSVPKTLVVSEAKTLLPRADIVWREDPMGDRHAQVGKIIQTAVLRGAGAMLFGRGQAGGVINQVSKTPLRIEQYKLSGSAGSYGYREVTADINKPIGESTALRINAMQRDEGSWRSNPATGSEPEIHRKGLAVSLGLNLRTDHQFWINHSVLTGNDNPDYGIAFDGTTKRPGVSTPFAPNTFWGTDRTFDKSDTRITTLVHEFRISADSQLRSQLRIAMGSSPRITRTS